MEHILQHSVHFQPWRVLTISWYQQTCEA